MACGDIVGVGSVLGDSHASLRDDYAVSCPELDVLVDAASAATGCEGARMMGGGFGGCVLALVDRASADSVAAEALRAYAARFRHPASAAVVHGVAGASGMSA
ncbi:MAG: hypothetical protein VX000_18400 [Myxococcota bacterium]|nr:hypothetical protein [Myxococcota bacterium]